MGWSPPDLGATRLEVSTDPAVAVRLLASQDGRVVNVVSGLRGCRVAQLALDWLLAHGAPVVVLAEAGDHSDHLASLRSLYYRWRVHRLRDNRVHVLAMGELGTRWYGRIGVPPDRVLEFGYSVDENDVLPLALSGREESGTIRLGFVGSLIPLKRVDLLLRALRHVKGDWTLDVVGDGPRAGSLRSLANDTDLDNRVTWHGSLPHRRAMEVVRELDALVLPSRYDGWGAVVAEALSLGVRAVCSDACGAATLLRSPEIGFVFRSGKHMELARVLTSIVTAGPRSDADRQALADWATCIHGRSMASHLVDAIGWLQNPVGSPPSPPWRKSYLPSQHTADFGP